MTSTSRNTSLTGVLWAVVRVVTLVILVVLTAWAAAALHFDSPWQGSLLALLYGGASVWLLWLARTRWLALAAWVGLFGLVTLWWLSLRPTDRQDWQPNVARRAWGVTNGNVVTMHNVRNCDYRTETDYTPRWEERSYDLSKLRGADIFITHWGPKWIAHPIVSFDFDGDHVAFSIETRMKIGQSYSALLGFFRQFELIYIVADERDVIRLRTNYRKDEDVCIYHLGIPMETARYLWMGYLAHLNRLHERAEWYNAATDNCTTNIRTDIAAARGRKPFKWDWRILLNGYMDEMLYQDGFLATGGLPFPELKERAFINPAARAANDDPDFSARIRAGRPGF